MHREIKGAEVINEVDHEDGDGLHNWRSNLRVCSHSQNLIARIKTRPIKSSRFRGVTWDKINKKWLSKTTFKKHTYNFGRFIDEVLAAKAFDVFATRTYGSYARLNFPI